MSFGAPFSTKISSTLRLRPTGSLISVFSFPSENVPAPPSPNCTLESGFSTPVFQNSSTSFCRSSTGAPCSRRNGRYPYSARKYAQKSPAGPHPTTTGRDFNFSLPPAGKIYGIASWSCTLPTRFFRVSIFKSCFSLSAFTSTV